MLSRASFPQVEAEFTEFDTRKENAVLDRMSQLIAKLGEFLRELAQYESAAMLQKRALDIDHQLFNNMSRRVAESTAALAKTKHLQVPCGPRSLLTAHVLATRLVPHTLGRRPLAHTSAYPASRTPSPSPLQRTTHARHTHTMASRLRHRSQGFSEEATDMLYLVLGVFKQLAKTDPSCEFDCANTLVQIADIARSAGGAVHARGQLGSALRTYKNVLGDNHPEVAHVHNSMGGLLFEIGTPESLQEARSHVEAAIAITDDSIGETDLTSAESRYILGKIHLREGELQNALKYMRQALEIRQNIYGYHNLVVIEVLEEVLLRSKRFISAAKM